MIPAKLFGKLLAPKNVALERFKREAKLSQYIPITHLVTDEIYATRKGGLGFTVKLSGIPYELTDQKVLDRLHYQLAFALRRISDDYIIYFTTHRHPENLRCHDDFPEGFARDFTTSYNQQFANSSLYVNDLYLSLIAKQKLLKVTEAPLDEQVRKIQHSIIQIKQTLALYAPKVLTVNDNYSELLRFLSILVNGEARDYLLPHSDIASYIPNKRLYFGHDAIHYEGIATSQYAAIITIKNYYGSMSAGYLDNLLNLPCTYIATHTFNSVSKSTALEAIRRQRNKMLSVDDKARSQIAEMAQAEDDIASEKINLGYHHNTLLLFADNLTALNDQAAQVQKVYENLGIIAVRETLNLENAWHAQIPGNMKLICRRSLITNLNFACFNSLHNQYSGYYGKNHLGSALMLAKTRSSNGFYLNIHEEASGKKADLPRGHTLIGGSTGGGKTTIAATLLTHTLKYRGRIIVFDRDRSNDLLVRALGGRYILFKPGQPTGINVCQLPDNAESRKLLRKLLKQLVSGVTLTPVDHNDIAEVVERNFSLPFAKRNLSNIASFFPKNFSGLTALGKWLRLPDRLGRSGEYAWVFDNEVNTLAFDQDIMGFDMTQLLDDHNDLITPVMMYLFHLTESLLDKRLTTVYLEEGWQFLNDAYWIAKLKNYYFTWRKSNGAIIFATQHINDVIKSPLRNAIIGQTITNILLPNSDADSDDYQKVLGLTEKEFNFIKTGTKPFFLYKQKQHSAVVQLDFSGSQRYLPVLSGNKDTAEIGDDLRAEFNDDWLTKFYQRVS